MKKKVTIIANSGYTVINFRSDLIKSLVQQNISVSVICPQKCSLMGNRDIKKELEEIGGVHYHVPLNRTGINPMKDCYTIFQLYIKLSEIRPDIVVSFYEKANVYGGLISRLFSKTKMVVNITGIGSIPFKQRHQIQIDSFDVETAISSRYRQENNSYFSK